MKLQKHVRAAASKCTRELSKRGAPSCAGMFAAFSASALKASLSVPSPRSRLSWFCVHRSQHQVCVHTSTSSKILDYCSILSCATVITHTTQTNTKAISLSPQSDDWKPSNCLQCQHHSVNSNSSSWAITFKLQLEISSTNSTHPTVTSSSMLSHQREEPSGFTDKLSCFPCGWRNLAHVRCVCLPGLMFAQVTAFPNEIGLINDTVEANREL